MSGVHISKTHIDFHTILYVCLADGLQFLALKWHLGTGFATYRTTNWHKQSEHYGLQNAVSVMVKNEPVSHWNITWKDSNASVSSPTGHNHSIWQLSKGQYSNSVTGYFPLLLTILAGFVSYCCNRFWFELLSCVVCGNANVM